MTNRSALDRYQDSALNPYAKGLLKPFKGKGELLRLRDELEAETKVLWQESTDIANRYNKSVVVQVGLWLKPHNTSQGWGRPLQWRDREQTRMGRKLWVAVMEHGRLSKTMRRKLVQIETERLIFNAKVAAVTRQIQRLNTLIKEIEYAEAFISAEA